jgi:hypothetical protein
MKTFPTQNDRTTTAIDARARVREAAAAPSAFRTSLVPAPVAQLPELRASHVRPVGQTQERVVANTWCKLEFGFDFSADLGLSKYS